MPTPAKPMPLPRRFDVVARSWKRANSRRVMPRPSSPTVTVAPAASVVNAMRVAPESSALATISVRMVSSRDSG